MEWSWSLEYGSNSDFVPWCRNSCWHDRYLWHADEASSYDRCTTQCILWSTRNSWNSRQLKKTRAIYRYFWPRIDSFLPNPWSTIPILWNHRNWSGVMLIQISVHHPRYGFEFNKYECPNGTSIRMEIKCDDCKYFNWIYDSLTALLAMPHPQAQNTVARHQNSKRDQISPIIFTRRRIKSYLLQRKKALRFPVDGSAIALL